MTGIVRTLVVVAGLAAVLALSIADTWAQRGEAPRGGRGGRGGRGALLDADGAIQFDQVQQLQEQLLQEQLAQEQLNGGEIAPSQGGRANRARNGRNAGANMPADDAGRMLSFDIRLLHLFSRTPIAEATQPLPVAGIDEQIAKWQADGLIARSTSGVVSALEGSVGTYQTGEMKLVVGGVSSGGGGRGGGIVGGTPSLTRDSLGVIFTCNGRVREDGKVVADLAVEESWYEYIPGDTRTNFQEGVAQEIVVTNPNIVPMGAPKRTFTLNNRILGSDGQTLMTHVSWTKRENGHHGTLLLVTPRVQPE